ncbi:MAG: PHP domain-containing protein, partial [Pseudomonadales bacterium]|nr:PHP domain-containing protein [Pseudomonadales bacterium]
MASLANINYAELHCISNFSFLTGASHPEELVREAAKQNYQALAITDECSLAGVVRAHVEAKKHDITLLIGSQFHTLEGLHLIAIAPHRLAYGKLSSV